MFTGIITACEPIRKIEKKQGNILLTFSVPKEWNLETGESINVNGVCSTVIENEGGICTVEYIPETLRLTTMGNQKKGDTVNLERSMTAADRISGHFVFGHIDGLGTVQEIQKDGDSHIITIAHEEKNSRYIIQKGSVCMNGISLTVIHPTENTFAVAIIPHTWEVTNMHALHETDEVNLEYDMLAKYIEKMTTNYGTT